MKSKISVHSRLGQGTFLTAAKARGLIKRVGRTGLVDVWVVRVTDEGPLGVPAARALLGSADRGYRRREDDERRSLVARAALMRLVATRTQVEPAEVAITYDERGRPSIGDSTIRVSIAHSGDYVVCAAAERRVGVDIERLDRPEADEGLARRVSTPAEFAQYHRLSEDARVAALVRLWAGKEAVTKAIGAGLAIPFDQIAVRGQTARLVGARREAWRVEHLEGAPAGYALALATETRWRRLRLHTETGDETDRAT
jgi:phosphopantetheinyl transferase